MSTTDTTSAAVMETPTSSETPPIAETPKGGGTGSGTRKPWSDAEFSLLLRAWTEADESSTRMPSARAVFERFQLLSQNGDSGRTEHSVLVKHKMALNAYDVILTYGATHARRFSSGADHDSAATDVWFRLPRTDRRRVFATLNTKTYPYMELKPEHTLTISEMYRKHNKAPRASAVRTLASLTDAPDAIAPKHELDTDDADDLECNARAFALATQQFDDLLMQLRQLEAQQRSAIDDDTMKTSGGAGPVPVRRGHGDGVESGTESEEDWDEIVPRSPVRNGALAADAAPLKRRASDAEPQDHVPSIKRPCVPRALLELASVLQTQVQALKTMNDGARAAHARAQTERQAIIRQLERDRVERQELLASVEGCYNALQAQRMACRIEHACIDHHASSSSIPSRETWWSQR